jgi:hypothetical protein
MLRALFLICFSAAVTTAESGFITKPPDTTKCIRPENLMTITAPDMNRTEFYSCTSRSIKLEMRDLDAISVWHGEITNKTGATFIGVANTTAEAKKLEQKYPHRFIVRNSPEYQKYLKTHKDLLQLLIKPK